MYELQCLNLTTALSLTLSLPYDSNRDGRALTDDKTYAYRDFVGKTQRKETT